MLFESIRLAFTSIRSNKMRSILTMLGMIIGIGSVISIVSIGDSMRGLVANEFESIGINRAYIYVSYQYMADDYRLSDYFTLDDIETVKRLFPNQIQYIAPEVAERPTVQVGRNTMQISLMGIDADFEKVQPAEIIAGRMINQADVQSAKNHVVLEQKTAEYLFGSDQVVGKTIRCQIRGDIDDYLIVGVYREKASILAQLFSGSESSERGTGYIPYSLLAKPGDYFFSLDFYMQPGIDQESFKSQLIAYEASQKNRPEDAIVFVSARDEMATMDSVMSGMSLAVGAIAAISLLVGGIGIMNIMLVSVTERTREIGIRKALGARTRDILGQFLIESAFIAAVGGSIGTLWGAGVVVLGGLILQVPVVIKLSVILFSVFFSAMVGVFFGFYPAYKAAKADPIIALRFE